MIFSEIPSKSDHLALFEYCVRVVRKKGKMNAAYTHQGWAFLIFGDKRSSSERNALMSIVKQVYSPYFSEDLNNYMFLEDKIKDTFPSFFDIEEESLNLFETIQKALEAEYKEQKKPRNRKQYRVSSCVNISSQENQVVYKAQIVVEEGDDPRFSEGMPIDFKVQESSYSCEVVEYDYANALLFFSSPRPLFSTYNARIVSDASMNTIALMKLLQEISVKTIEETIPLHKFLNNTTRNVSEIPHGEYPTYLDDLLSADESQQEAFHAALDNDISFIWGPPGTGKSYTLSAIIMALYHMGNERTAVCCLSNVAVDQLVNKVVDIITVKEPMMSRGQFYRAGRTTDATLLATDFLFPDDEESKKLRTKIKVLTKKVEYYRDHNKQFTDEAITTKAALKELREKLKVHTDDLINQVKVVFSTISNFVLNTRLKDSEFDNLIVDEASMLAEPQLIALASKVTKRIILVGDFQQLSPISEAGVPMLSNSVFKLAGIDINHTDHKALHQLLHQRRSNPKLVDVINKAFYADKLIAANKKFNHIVECPPYSGCVIGMNSIQNGEVRFTKGGTRQNKANAEAVMNLLDLYSMQERESFSIGVITPYTGQVSMLKALFIERKYKINFQKRVRIGTVHTFQGSECDVIIFDMVDSSKFEKGKPYFGKIYEHNQGEQLLNVAISRARHKLIVVCDPDFITTCPGGKVSDKTVAIFQKLLLARHTHM